MRRRNLLTSPPPAIMERYCNDKTKRAVMVIHYVPLGRRWTVPESWNNDILWLSRVPRQSNLLNSEGDYPPGVVFRDLSNGKYYFMPVMEFIRDFTKLEIFADQEGGL